MLFRSPISKATAMAVPAKRVKPLMEGQVKASMIEGDGVRTC